jgi:hypothetical protein
MSGATTQIGKVVIGLFAGICATFLPRIVTALSTSDPTGKIDVFGEDFIMLALVFSGFLGVGVMLLKWAEPLQPAALFTAALGIPAIVAGAFNMSASVSELQNKTAEVAKLAGSIQERAGVRTLQPQVLTLPGIAPQSALPDDWLERFALIAPAFAQELEEAIQQQRGFDAGRVIDEPQYLIVLASFEKLEEAQAALDRYKAAAPAATVVQGTTTTYIVDSLEPKPESEATLRAVELQQLLQGVGPPGSVSLLPLGQ